MNRPASQRNLGVSLEGAERATLVSFVVTAVLFVLICIWIW